MSRRNAEDDVRLNIFNSILRCPHRDMDKILALHIEAHESDPLFYAKLAVWHKHNGEIRDHNEAFTALLCLDPIEEHRETGLALLRQMPTYLKERVRGLIKGKNVKIRTKLNQTFKRAGKTINKVNIEKKFVGLKKNLPNSFKTEIKQYLKWLESDNTTLDNALLHGFNAIMSLYASIRIKPSQRAKNIIFEGKIPKNSRLSIIRDILNADSPQEKAELIIENRIPYTTAVGLIKQMTPSILISLISVMTPQEIINNMGSLKDHGAYDNKDVKKLVLDKLKKAETKKGVAALKSKVAKKSAKIEDVEINTQLDKVADEGIKKTAQITIPTAIIIDKSGSMNRAIEVGKELASAVSGATEDDLYVIAVDTMGREITSRGKSLTDWEQAFRAIRAGGGTSLGAGVNFLTRKKYYVEQIVIITDEGENNNPRIHTALKEYIDVMKVTPNIVILKVDPISSMYYNTATTVQFQNNIKSVVGDFTRLEIDTNDTGYYAIPTIIPILAQKSKMDLLYEVMDYDLMERKSFDEMHGKKKTRKKKETVNA